jgi:hypothetical protein
LAMLKGYFPVPHSVGLQDDTGTKKREQVVVIRS